jgi:GntR family transcriptional regulator, transcriptional repressor for pyruvate dehydrogenase complex
MLDPILHRSVPDDVFDQLREAIMSGRYRPGDRLPSQRALAADLGVNMASVREALGRLEQLRLLEVRHGSATRVLDWRRSGGLESLALEHGAGEPLLDDLFEARGLLLVESARLAASRRSEEQASALLELAQTVAGATDSQTALLADWSFMSGLVEAAGNLVFQLIMNSVRELYLPRVEAFAGLVSDPQELAPLYLQAARAVDAGDGEAAATAVERLASIQAAAMSGSSER